jgi:hypothetical protein
MNTKDIYIYTYIYIKYIYIYIYIILYRYVLCTSSDYGVISAVVALV